MPVSARAVGVGLVSSGHPQPQPACACTAAQQYTYMHILLLVPFVAGRGRRHRTASIPPAPPRQNDCSESGPRSFASLKSQFNEDGYCIFTSCSLQRRGLLDTAAQHTREHAKKRPGGILRDSAYGATIARDADTLRYVLRCRAPGSALSLHVPYSYVLSSLRLHSCLIRRLLHFLYEASPLPFQHLQFYNGTQRRTHSDVVHFDTL